MVCPLIPLLFISSASRWEIPIQLTSPLWGPSDCVSQKSWNGNTHSVAGWRSCVRGGKVSSLPFKRICSWGKIAPHPSVFIGSLGSFICVQFGRRERGKAEIQSREGLTSRSLSGHVTRHASEDLEENAIHWWDRPSVAVLSPAPS